MRYKNCMKLVQFYIISFVFNKFRFDVEEYCKK